ncbi:hypothetical protein BGX23_012449 [Mortierella sp. AD031]|nr:hypothetical protein BGX23_012449 [Mortierella sp. AD031]
MKATKSSSPSSSSTPSHSKNVFRLHGVNVLNRKNVDSIARLTALERRRATHILDERQRRDTMNQLLTELANLVRDTYFTLTFIIINNSATSTTATILTITAAATTANIKSEPRRHGESAAARKVQLYYDTPQRHCRNPTATNLRRPAAHSPPVKRTFFNCFCFCVFAFFELLPAFYELYTVSVELAAFLR